MKTNRNPHYDFELSDEDKKILKELEAKYKSGKAITYTREQVKKLVFENIKKKKQ